MSTHLHDSLSHRTSLHLNSLLSPAPSRLHTSCYLLADDRSESDSCTQEVDSDIGDETMDSQPPMIANRVQAAVHRTLKDVLMDSQPSWGTVDSSMIQTILPLGTVLYRKVPKPHPVTVTNNRTMKPNCVTVKDNSTTENDAPLHELTFDLRKLPPKQTLLVHLHAPDHPAHNIFARICDLQGFPNAGTTARFPDFNDGTIRMPIISQPFHDSAIPRIIVLPEEHLEQWERVQVHELTSDLRRPKGSPCGFAYKIPGILYHA